MSVDQPLYQLEDRPGPLASLLAAVADGNTILAGLEKTVVGGPLG